MLLLLLLEALCCFCLLLLLQIPLSYALLLFAALHATASWLRCSDSLQQQQQQQQYLPSRCCSGRR